MRPRKILSKLCFTSYHRYLFRWLLLRCKILINNFRLELLLLNQKVNFAELETIAQQEHQVKFPVEANIKIEQDKMHAKLVVLVTSAMPRKVRSASQI
jgi:hypothetical protein